MNNVGSIVKVFYVVAVVPKFTQKKLSDLKKKKNYWVLNNSMLIF